MEEGRGWATHQLMRNNLAGTKVNSRGFVHGSDQPTDRAGRGARMIERENNPVMAAAIRDLRKRLSDGQWKRKEIVATVAKKYGVPLASLRRLAGIFESDNTKWVCILTDDTPDLAPGEK